MIFIKDKEILRKEFLEAKYEEEKFLHLVAEAVGSPSGPVYPLEDEEYEGFKVLGEVSLDGKELILLSVKVENPRQLERVRKYHHRKVVKFLRDYHIDSALVAFHCEGCSEWRLSLFYIEYKLSQDGQPLLEESPYKRFTYLLGETEPAYTPTKQLWSLIEKRRRGQSITLEDIKEAFSVEKLSEEFFDEHLYHFNRLWKEIYERIKEKEDALILSRDTAHQVLNRLMFVFVIQKRRDWFDHIPDGKLLIDYLLEEYKSYIASNPHKRNTFFKNWLQVLFLKGFNNARKHVNDPDVKELPQSVQNVLSLLPYLNGGLFAKNELDELEFELRDELIEEVIGFLKRYNFTVVESLELDKEVAINPELIGTIYEKFVNLQTTPDLKEKYEAEGKTKGIIYTQPTEIAFMVKKSFVHYLANNTDLPLERIYSFVFDEDFSFRSREEYEALKRAVETVKIVDPACGSGSFLVGYAELLHDLYKKLQRYEPEEKLTDFAIRKRIIQENLYGVDIQEWAVRIAELRLWLFLIVESNLKREEMLFEPLLPNLSFQIRQGDSLIEEIGNMDMSLLRKERSISPSLKRRIRKLQKEKLRYARNEEGHLSKREIEKMEIDIYSELIEERILEIKKKIQSLTVKLRTAQGDMFGEGKRQEDLFKDTEKRIDTLEKELNFWKEIKENLKESKPFVWDIDFAEVFLDDEKKGFDIVIGNPPYVRQEKIAHPLLNEKDFSPEEWRKKKREYKEKLQKMVKNLYGERFVPDGKADLYVYFYFKSLSLLNPKGVFAFITSNSWLDVGFGKSLQEFLLRRTRIYSINDNLAKRSFKEADVNTIIIFTSAPSKKEKENLNHTARFVMWKKPFEEVITKENLLYIDRIEPKVEGGPLPELAENVVNTDNFRVFPIKQKDLYCDGAETYSEQERIEEDCTSHPYKGNKWGGKFLRAPDIFFTILKKGKGKLVRLGDIAEVRRGFTTGANEFFYVEDITDRMSEEDLRRIENLRGLSSLEDIKKRGLRVVKPSKWGANAKDYKLFLIEPEFLKPVIKSPRELKTIVVREEDLKYRVFMCNKSRKELQGTFALDYIKWGEKEGFHKRPTCASRKEWWRLGERTVFSLHFNYLIHEVGVTYVGNIYASDNFHEIYLDLSSSLFLNSTIFYLFQNISIRSNFGDGLGKIQTYELEDLFILCPNVEDFQLYRIDKTIHSIFTELGFDPDKPIREQEPNPLPDRKALDDIVFDALGLTEEERKEVYWALAELVKARLDKARSV